MGENVGWKKGGKKEIPQKEAVLRAGDLVTELLELLHFSGADEVRPDAKQLPELDIERPKVCERLPQHRRLLVLELLTLPITLLCK